MTEELFHPELLGNCIRCKTTIGELNNRQVKKPFGTNIIKIFKINFSVCENCKDEVNKIFERGDFIRRILKWAPIILFGFFFLIWVLAPVFLKGYFVDDWLFFIIAIILTFGSIFGYFIICVLLIFYLRFYGLGKYLRIKKDGRVILKDPINKKKSVEFNILQFYNEIFTKKSSKTYEYCPNCGSNQITNSGFCAECGKSLKI